jgi:hypothetical protein
MTTLFLSGSALVFEMKRAHKPDAIADVGSHSVGWLLPVMFAPNHAGPMNNSS